MNADPHNVLYVVVAPNLEAQRSALAEQEVQEGLHMFVASAPDLGALAAQTIAPICPPHHARVRRLEAPVNLQMSFTTQKNPLAAQEQGGPETVPAILYQPSGQEGQALQNETVGFCFPQLMEYARQAAEDGRDVTQDGLQRAHDRAYEEYPEYVQGAIAPDVVYRAYERHEENGDLPTAPRRASGNDKDE